MWANKLLKTSEYGTNILICMITVKKESINDNFTSWK